MARANTRHLRPTHKDSGRLGRQLMVTTDIAWAPHKRSPAVNATLLVAGLTATGIALGAIGHGLAGDTLPHPTLTGGVSEAAGILVNNARVLIAPFALWALGFPTGPQHAGSAT